MNRNKFWQIVNASKRPIKEILSVCKVGDKIEDPSGIAYDCLHSVTKDFVQYMRKAHNEGRNKLYKQVLSSSDKQSTRYNLMHQAAMYSEKLDGQEKATFARELEWENALSDETFEWVHEVFMNVKDK